MGSGEPLHSTTRIGRTLSVMIVALAAMLTLLIVAAAMVNVAAIPRHHLSSLLAAGVALSSLLLVAVAAGSMLLRKGLAMAAERDHQANESVARDHLTGAWSRPYFIELLRREVPTTGGRRFAYLQVDLDHLKTLNDTFGHAAGDEALIHLVATVRTLLPTADIGRLGGDEFGVLIADCGVRMQVRALAQRIIECLHQPAPIAGRPMRLSATIGFAIVPDDTRLALDLINLADLALYQAKQQRGTACSYNSHMLVDARSNRFLTRELKAAVYLDQLDLHYQPLFGRDGRTLEGYEALARWQHPLLGTISPAQFIALAEQSTLIEDVGEWVLKRVCRDIGHLCGVIGINVSPKQLRQPGFGARMLELIAASGVAPDRLFIEITETVLLDFSQVVRTNLDALRSAGIGIVLDDFGAGFASLHYLRDYRFDSIKIDHSYVRAAASSTIDMAFVSVITELARVMDITVLAEGIESEVELELMKAAGCHRFQGFYLGRPQPIADIIRAGKEGEAA